MAEYIERDALNKEIEQIVRQYLGENTFSTTFAAAVLVEFRQNAADEIPSADVAPVVHGRWEWREEWETHYETHSVDLISCGWYCTECGIELGEYLTEKTGQHIILDDDCRKPKLTSCPNCGAKMDAEA